MTARPAGRPALILFRGRKVALPALLFFSQRMALAATSSVSTTTDIMPPPMAVDKAVEWASSFGAHSSAMVPKMPSNSPESRAPSTAAAPPVKPDEPEFDSMAARARANWRSTSLKRVSTALASSTKVDSFRWAAVRSRARLSRSDPSAMALISCPWSSLSATCILAPAKASSAFWRSSKSNSPAVAERSTSDCALAKAARACSISSSHACTVRASSATSLVEPSRASRTVASSFAAAARASLAALRASSACLMSAAAWSEAAEASSKSASRRVRVSPSVWSREAMSDRRSAAVSMATLSR